jgi:hypothetical protein
MAERAPGLFVRIPVTLPMDAAFASIPDAERFACVGAYAVTLAWAGANLTDGAVPQNALRMLRVRPKLATLLVDVGKWERTRDGIAIVDYAKWQATAQEIDRNRAKEREKKAAQRAKQRARNPHDFADSGELSPGDSPGMSRDRRDKEEIEEGEETGTAATASGRGSVSLSQLAFFSDAYVMARGVLPTDEQMADARAMSRGELGGLAQRLFHDAHAEYREVDGSGAIYADDMREAMLSDGRYDLLSTEGRLRLDARAAAARERETEWIADLPGTTAGLPDVWDDAAEQSSPRARAREFNELADVFGGPTKGLPE